MRQPDADAARRVADEAAELLARWAQRTNTPCPAELSAAVREGLAPTPSEELPR